jgi:outer membrane protein
MRNIVLIACLCVGAFAENLSEVYELAKQNDQTFQAAKESLRASEEIEYQGYSVLFPRLDLSANDGWMSIDMQYGKPSPFFPSGLQKYNSSGYTATLSQPLFRKESLDIFRESKILLRQARYGFDAAEQGVLLKSAEAYFDFLSSQENLEFLQAQKKAVAGQFEEAKLNFKLGNATAVETTEAKARYDLLEARELLAMQEVSVKKDALEKMAGKEIAQTAKCSENIDESVFAAGSFDTVKGNVIDSPTIKRAKEQMEFAALEYERSKAKFFPTIDAIAQAGRTNANGSPQGMGSEQNSKYIGVSLSLNLFNGGFDLSRAREQLANKNKAAYEYEAAKLDTQNRALQNYLGVSVGIAQMKASKEALKSANMALDAAKIGAKVGLRSSLDLLNSEQALYEAKKAYSASKYSLMLSHLRLKALQNTLVDNDISRINSFLVK